MYTPARVQYNYVQDARTRTHHTHTVHTHTHTVQTDRGEGQCCLTELVGEEICLELAFEGKESSRVPDVTDFFFFYI